MNNVIDNSVIDNSVIYNSVIDNSIIDNKELLKKQGEDKNFKGLSNIWIEKAIQYKHVYNFTWLERPILQMTQDIYAMQELIWKVKPDLIIETGIAHGGSLICYASMLALLDYCEGHSIDDPSEREVVGIDIEIREHNRKAITNHPLYLPFITLIEGSSIDSCVVKQIEKKVSEHIKIMVFLDSNHTHEHVLKELQIYAQMVTKLSYCVVWDSGIEELPTYMLENSGKSWGKGNNPKTAIHEFLKNNNQFEIDKELENKLMITSTSDGFLRRIR